MWWKVRYWLFPYTIRGHSGSKQQQKCFNPITTLHDKPPVAFPFSPKFHFFFFRTLTSKNTSACHISLLHFASTNTKPWCLPNTKKNANTGKKMFKRLLSLMSTRHRPDPDNMFEMTQSITFFHFYRVCVLRVSKW